MVHASTVKDKANHAVILDKATADKLYKDVQSYRLITVATLVDRLKINGSLARKALADLEEKGQIKKIVGHSKLSIYSTLHSICEKGNRNVLTLHSSRCYRCGIDSRNVAGASIGVWLRLMTRGGQAGMNRDKHTGTCTYQRILQTTKLLDCSM
jgi:small subunit ribosomal protein S25e